MTRQARSRSEHNNTYDRKTVADRRGIFAIRRRVEPVKDDKLTAAMNPLIPEFGGAGRLFVPETLAVTVIGFSRYSKQHIQHGPATKDFVDSVSTVRKAKKILLGKLDVFGSGNDHKLGFHIDSPWIHQEIEAYEKVLNDRGFPLNPCNGDPEKKYLPHLSIGHLYTDEIVGYFKEPETLERISKLTNLVGEYVTLQAYQER